MRLFPSKIPVKLLSIVNKLTSVCEKKEGNIRLELYY